MRALLVAFFVCFASLAYAADTPATNTGGNNFTCPVSLPAVVPGDLVPLSVRLVQTNVSPAVNFGCVALTNGESGTVAFTLPPATDATLQAQSTDGASCGGNVSALSVDTCSASTVTVTPPTIP